MPIFTPYVRPIRQASNSKNSIPPKLERTAEDCIYAAGLFDGEGCVGIYKRLHKSKYPGFFLLVDVTNTYLPILYWLQDRWGGSVAISGAGNSKHKIAMRWQTSSFRAKVFLEDVLPFLIIKKERTMNAIAFQSAKRQKGKMNPTTKEEMADDLGFFEIAKNLNRRGPEIIDELIN